MKKRSPKIGFLSSHGVVGLLLCATCVCSLAGATQPASSRTEALQKILQRTLTFAERVSYQRAIEEVYWRYRIWPKDRSDPKPSLDAVMPQEQLEKKVAGYLRDSEVLQGSRHGPITAEQLQAELERMARHTKQPDVLRELFGAVGNDPFAAAECLARPVLAERLIADGSAQDETGRFGSAHSSGVRSMSMDVQLPNAAYALPRITKGDPPCIDDTWTATSTANAPTNRAYHKAVWTGTEMIIWGGYNSGSDFNTGGRYNPSTNSWTVTSTTNAPAARSNHTAVWTGSEMIIWGGSFFDTGGRYNPATDSWTVTSTTNAPEGRYVHTAVWTGTEMIVWGGYLFSELSTGGRYNPTTDSWTATSTTNAAAARTSHTAVWTGSEMIVWGGYGDDDNELNTGGRYNPSVDSWTATSITNAPAARDYHPAVWTGSEMIIWGGHSNNIGEFDTGGRYNPSTDSWTATNIGNAPSARDSHTAVWSGNEMLVWGGYNGNGSYLNTGARYCAQSGSPTPTPTPTATPTATSTPTPTPTPCTGRCTPTPRPRPTPASRP